MNPVLPKQLDEIVQRLVDSLKPEQIIECKAGVSSSLVSQAIHQGRVLYG
jgi:hypothetical protein